MKNIKTILALFIFAFCILSCSKDEETKVAAAPVKEYPANMIYQWDGTFTQTDLGNTPTTSLTLNVKSNGVLEVLRWNQPTIIGDWYMIGNILTCTYTSSSGERLSYQRIKGKTFLMVGFRGLNGETFGAGRVRLDVV